MSLGLQYNLIVHLYSFFFPLASNIHLTTIKNKRNLSWWYPSKILTFLFWLKSFKYHTHSKQRVQYLWLCWSSIYLIISLCNVQLFLPSRQIWLKEVWNDLTIQVQLWIQSCFDPKVWMRSVIQNVFEDNRLCIPLCKSYQLLSNLDHCRTHYAPIYQDSVGPSRILHQNSSVLRSTIERGYCHNAKRRLQLWIRISIISLTNEVLSTYTFHSFRVK